MADTVLSSQLIALGIISFNYILPMEKLRHHKSDDLRMVR